MRETFCKARLPVLLMVLPVLFACSSTPGPTDQDREGDLYLQQGVDYLARGNVERATFELEKAMKLKPRDPEVQFALGTALLYKENLPGAEARFREAIRLNPNHADALSNLGVVHLQMKKYDEALADFQKALDQLSYTTPEKAHTNMGRAYLGKNDYVRALDHLKRALAIQPNLPQALNALGEVYLASDRPDKAREVLADAVAKNPQNLPAQFYLGVAYQKLKDLKKAREQFRLVAEKADPNSDLGRSARGYLDLID